MEELARELARVVERDYRLTGEVSCRFLRHGFNDHFRVFAGEEEYHLRLYLEGKYYIDGDDDFRSELALTDALADAGCPVARPVRRRDGGLLSVVELAGAERRIALFELASGGVAEERTLAVAATLGDAVARIHTVADNASIPRDRYHLDERYLIRQPIDQLRRAAPGAPELPALERLAEELSEFVRSLPRDTPSYGLIHADLHPGNVHFTEHGQATIFDFDHCAFGWRAYDLAPLRMSLDDERWEAVLEAYEAERTLPEGLDRIDAFTKMRMLWDIGDMLAMEATWGRSDVTEKVPEHLPRLAAALGVSSSA